MDGGDAERKVEKPEDSRMVTGGTRESKERARQTSAAAKENTRPEETMLMKKVLHRPLSLLDEQRRLQNLT
jgi:hypothetical protein